MPSATSNPCNSTARPDCKVHGLSVLLRILKQAISLDPRMGSSHTRKGAKDGSTRLLVFKYVDMDTMSGLEPGWLLPPPTADLVAALSKSPAAAAAAADQSPTANLVAGLGRTRRKVRSTHYNSRCVQRAARHMHTWWLPATKTSAQPTSRIAGCVHGQSAPSCTVGCMLASVAPAHSEPLPPAAVAVVHPLPPPPPQRYAAIRLNSADQSSPASPDLWAMHSHLGMTALSSGCGGPQACI